MNLQDSPHSHRGTMKCLKDLSTILVPNYQTHQNPINLSKLTERK